MKKKDPKCCVCKSPVTVLVSAHSRAKVKREMETLHGVPICRQCATHRWPNASVRKAAQQMEAPKEGPFKEPEELKSSQARPRDLSLVRPQAGAKHSSGQYEGGGMKPSGRGQAELEKGHRRKAA